MMQPLVSIIVVSYNHARFIEETLNSIKSQNYDNLELILADDASNDNSVEVFENWIKENNQYVVKKNFHTKNTGLRTVLNECFQMVDGDYMYMSAGDDFLAPNVLNHMVEKLENLGNEYGIYYGDIEVVDAETKTIPDEDGIKFQKNYLPINGEGFAECVNSFHFWVQASLIRFDHFRKMRFKIKEDFISEDWFIVLELSRNYKIYGEKKLITYYRKLESSLTRQNWIPLRIQNIYFSQFDMILSFLNHPKNNKNDNIVIVDKLISLLLNIEIKSSYIKVKILKKYLSLLVKSRFNFYAFKKLKKVLKKITQ